MNVGAIEHNNSFDISDHPSLNKKSKEISDEQTQLNIVEEESAVQPVRPKKNSWTFITTYAARETKKLHRR